ncbi:MAG: hypothetical protein FWD53_01205 [Phycisphaerales bacterium]|nr:hypothetical protein [Phycisphaerales bacterium]
MEDEPRSFQLSGPIRYGCVVAVAWVFGGIGGIVCLLGLIGWALGRNNMGGFICGTPFVIVAVILWLSGRQLHRRQELRKKHADEPWLWNPKWADRIRYSDGEGAFRDYFAAALLLAIGTGGLAYLWHHPHGEIRVPTYIFLAFVLAGFVFLAFRGVKTRRLMKFGPSELALATFPGVIGGQLVGVIYTGRKLHAADGYHLRLRCVAGKEGGVLWEDTATMARGVMEDDTSRTAIPVGFNIPADYPPTGIVGDSNAVYWQLQVRAKVPGLHYFAAFKVPVFCTAESAAVVEEGKVDPVAAYREPELPQTAPTLPGIALREIAGGLELEFRAARNVGVAWGITFKGLGLIAFGVGMGFMHAWIYSVVFSLTGLSVSVQALRAWFLTKRIIVADGMVQLESRFMGFRRQQEFAANEIVAMQCVLGRQFWQTLYRIEMMTESSKTLVIADGISKKKEADWLAGKIGETLKQHGSLMDRMEG